MQHNGNTSDHISIMDVRAILGISSGVGSKQIASMFGIRPAIETKYGRGKLTLWNRADAIAAAKQYADKQTGQTKQSAAFVQRPNSTSFVPTQKALDALERIEEKMDKILAIWQPDQKKETNFEI